MPLTPIAHIMGGYVALCGALNSQSPDDETTTCLFIFISLFSVVFIYLFVFVFCFYFILFLFLFLFDFRLFLPHYLYYKMSVQFFK